MCLALHLRCQSGSPSSFEDPLRQGVPEAADHASKLWQAYSNVKRYYSGTS